VFRKKHPLTVSFVSRVDLNKNCSEYTQGTVDCNNVKIRYSLRPMTKLWRHICLSKVGVSLQYTISQEPWISFLRVQGTCWCIDAVVSCIIWWNLRQWLKINKFSFINQIKFDHHWCKIMLQQLNVVGDSCKSTLVLKRKADILTISYGISIYQ